MKLAALALVSLCASGCTGYFAARQETVPAPPADCSEEVHAPRCVPSMISRREAVDIALGEVSRRGCSSPDVDRVECKKHYWEIYVSDGGRHRHHRERIRVRVDHRTGEILSYKSKHDHEDDDD